MYCSKRPLFPRILSPVLDILDIERAHTMTIAQQGTVALSRITHFEGRVIALFHGLPAGISGAL
jgi:hypothetical protein